MPDDLADAIFTRYTLETVQDVLANWEAIGTEGQQTYRRYLDRAWTRSSRRERCSLAADQLYNPEMPFAAGGGGGDG